MCDDPSFLPWSRRRNSKGQPKKEVAPDLECASPELSQGYRILQDVIGISKFFLEQPNRREKGMRDYYDVISSPISFREMQQKFARGEYSKISEFVKDVRCLLLNCYTYFGPRHVHTKRALKVEHVLEKELSKLPMDLRSQCSLESTHGIKDAEEMKDAGDVQSQLLQSVIGERSRRERERKLRLSEERRKEKEGRERDLLLWEQEKLFTDLNRRNMECMWELPVIGHFVALLLEQLNISNISMFELERIILMPQASKSLAALMTTLLSTPQFRMKLHTKPPMPYKIWTRKLEFKVSSWYKIYVKSDKNPDIVFEKLGIEHQFWKIMGDWNPLKEYEFHELTFHQRVLLIKALCDYIMQNHKNLRETIAEKRDDFGICLGEDRSRAKFLYFPQFLDHDVRIYRQASKPKSWIDRDMDHQAQLLAENVKNVPAKCEKSDVTSMSKRYRKKSAWQRGKIVKHQKCLHPKGTKGLPKTSCKSPRSESNHATESSVPDSAAGANENCVDKRDSRLLCNVNPGPHDEDVCEEKQNEHSSHTDKNLETGELETSAVLNVDSGSKVSNCKRENVDMELSSNLTTLSVDFCASISESQFEKCSDDLEFTLCCHLRPKQQCTDCDMTIEPSLDVSDKNDFTAKDDEGDNVEKVSLNQTKGVDQDIKNCVLETQKTRRPLYNPYWLEPNPDDFKLVADSLEGVRQLLTKYCDDDVVLIKRFDEKSQKGCRPSCEVRLARRLASIMSDLHSLELKIVTNTKQTREKLYKEWQDFENRSAEYADPDEAFWLNEKDPPEIPETQAYQNSEILDAANLPQTPATDPGDASEDPQQTSSNGMKLRNRRLEDSTSRDKFPQLVASEESSEDDSDESDNWVMPKTSTKRKINNPAARSKKKHTSEEMPQQPPLKCDESSSHMAANSSPEIEVLGGQKVTGRKYSTLPAATLRIKKRLFSQDEASHSEANRQLEWEKNRQTLVNSAANKVAELQQPITYIVENKNKIILDARGKMTVVPIDNKAKTMETTSQNPTSTVVLQGSVRVSTATSVQQSPSSGLHQRRINKISGNRRVFEPVRRVISDVIFVSDDSENSDVEFIETVYNPKLDETLRKKVADLRHERRKLKTQNRCSTKDNTVSDAQADTSRVKPVTSTCNSVTALPNQFQTGISTPQTSAARPVPNATTPQNKVGRQHAATRVQLEMHSVSQNADSRNETLQKQVLH
ncbi:hypothetical protein L798_11113 [Zootermopsis nevadensis]|uniref:Bromo domain-containing protein n=1 Tax=Zootermopsis nevadensis TaxID=136037 RepID=A0A067R8Y1_ZOONE|nr:hypothetical protein L798_11113 [Zootermopsis nevadensis]